MAIASKAKAKREKPVHVPAPTHTNSHPKSPPASSSSAGLALQHSVGNLAVQRLLNAGVIRAKLTISQPNDPDEQEADAVADRIMRMPDSATKTSCPTCAASSTPCLTCSLNAPQQISRKAIGPTNHEHHTSAQQLMGRLGSGLPLDSSTRAFFETRFGTDLSYTRIHTNSSAMESARALNARAYALGPNIVFGSGEYNPESHNGKRLLAHELAHTIQQKDASSTFVQRDGPVYYVIEHAAVDTLERYARLRAALSESEWQQLNRAASRRYDTPPSFAEREDETITTVDVPLRRLLVPALPEPDSASAESWLVTSFRAGYENSGALAVSTMAQSIQTELVNRWVELNPEMLDETVSVSLIDPSGAAGGLSTLSFRVHGVPVETTDGGLLIGAVDRVLENYFPSLMSQLQNDVLSLQFALVIAQQGRAIADAVDRIIDTPDVDLAQQALSQCTAVVEDAISKLSVVDSAFSGEVSTLSARLAALRDTGIPDRVVEHEAWRTAHAPAEPLMVIANRQLDEEMDAARSRGYAGESLNAMMIISSVLQGIFPGEQEAYDAYTEGSISLGTYLDLESEIRIRGYFIAGTMVAISLASLGLGIFLAPTIAAESLIGEVLLAGYLGGAESLTPLVISNLYSNEVSFSDPRAQAIWGMGSYSMGDLAVAGGIGFGLGAVFPLSIGVLGRIRSRAEAQALILAAQAGETSTLGRATIRSVGPGVLEISVPEESAIVRITEDGWELFGPAGEETAALLGSGSWGDPSIGTGPLGAFRGNLHFGGENPFAAFHAYEGGWGFLSPGSETPFAVGTWAELLASREANSFVLPLRGRFPLSSLGVPEPMSSRQGLLPPPREGTWLPPGATELPDGQGIIIRSSTVTHPPESPFGLLPESGSSGLPHGDWRIADLHGPSLRALPESSLPYAGAHAWGRGAGNWWLYEPSSSMPVSSRLRLYRGPAGDHGVVLDIPGQVRSLHSDPSSAASTGRRYPMTVADMTDPYTGSVGARSHLDPHARSRRVVLPDGSLGIQSTRDSFNFVSHDRRYNTWIRQVLEGRLSGSRWQAIQVWDTPRATTGGYPIVTEEIIVQLAPDGSPQRAWRFPTTEGAWDAASDINAILGPRDGVGYSGGTAEIHLSELPLTLR